MSPYTTPSAAMLSTIRFLSWPWGSGSAAMTPSTGPAPAGSCCFGGWSLISSLPDVDRHHALDIVELAEVGHHARGDRLVDRDDHHRRLVLSLAADLHAIDVDVAVSQHRAHAAHRARLV